MVEFLWIQNWDFKLSFDRLDYCCLGVVGIEVKDDVKIKVFSKNLDNEQEGFRKVILWEIFLLGKLFIFFCIVVNFYVEIDKIQR